MSVALRQCSARAGRRRTPAALRAPTDSPDNVENNLLVHRLGGWGFGMVLAIGYIVFVYAKFRGKVDLRAGGH